MHLIADATDLARLEAARRHGFGVESRRVLAVCGERLALVEARDPDIDGESFHRFVVEEIDARHRFVRWWARWRQVVRHHGLPNLQRSNLQRV